LPAKRSSFISAPANSQYRRLRVSDGGLIPEDRIGALTQIFEEYGPEATPEIINGVVRESTPRPTSTGGWTIRALDALKK
jgi:hypothetical protein